VEIGCFLWVVCNLITIALYPEGATASSSGSFTLLGNPDPNHVLLVAADTILLACICAGVLSRGAQFNRMSVLQVAALQRQRMRLQMRAAEVGDAADTARYNLAILQATPSLSTEASEILGPDLPNPSPALSTDSMESRNPAMVAEMQTLRSQAVASESQVRALHECNRMLETVSACVEVDSKLYPETCLGFKISQQSIIIVLAIAAGNALLSWVLLDQLEI